MPQREFVVETPERIVLRYALAGAGARAAAWIIDLALQVLILGAGLVVSIFILGSDTGGADEPDSMGLGAGLAGAFYYILLFLVKWGYYVLFESLMRGSTPGKRAMGIAAVRADGEPMDFESVVVRNLVRAVDDFPVIPLLGFLVAISTRRGQRLGDIAAGTIVVQAPRERLAMPEELDETRAAAGEAAIPAPGEAGRPAARLSEAELYVLRRFLNDRARLPEAMARSTADRLAAQALARTGISMEGRDAVAYIAYLHALHAQPDAPAEKAE